ncbi:MAG: ppsA [Verrucomicrobiales bacterium]|nr:ppsA [Verrucomicrobiales bacterium]
MKLRLHPLLLAWFALPGPAASPLRAADPAAALPIVSPAATPGGHFQAGIPSATGAYYLLQRADSTAGPWESVRLAPGTGDTLALTDPAAMARRAFYRIAAVPSDAPLDSDGDGQDDLAEWLAGSMGNAFNPAPPPAATDAAVIMTAQARYEELAHRDNFPGASDVREVKFLITGADTAAPRLYFLNTNIHQYHYYFAQDVLGYSQDLTTFNNQTYFTDARRQIAGSLIFYPHYTRAGGPPGLYAIEFWPSDGVGFSHVRMACGLVSRALPWMDRRLAYHPAGLTQEQRMESEAALWDAAAIDRISSDELFASTTYSVLNPGVSFGRLVLGGTTTAVSARDIVVLPTVPADLSRVAGIVTAAPQTPLSHINLKAKQNHTPNCYLRGALTDPRLTALAGKNVRFEVASDSLLLREATPEEVETYLDALRPPNPTVPPRDLSVNTIRPLTSVNFADSRNVGAKAANAAELRKILPAGMYPEGFAVPFAFYDAFMKDNGFYAYAQFMLQEPGFKADPAVREVRLTEFRELLRKGSVSPELQTAFAAVQGAFPSGVPIRCRSSTNNEDLPGFNGAGLYDSYTHRPDEGSLHKTVRKVWASLWNFRAFEERDFYRIDHFAAAMGVLLIPNTDDELANGVAVSKNLIDPNWRGYYVNVQKGEELITNPDQTVIPEEFLIASLMGLTTYEIQHVTFSSLQPPRTSLLSTAQAFDLADRLLNIQYHFRNLYNGWSDPAFAMEIEFKITKDNKLYIKQARPWVE